MNLYPTPSETRTIHSLDGVWRFVADLSHCGFDDDWPARPLNDTVPMPVPSSYNDIIPDARVRDHVGWVWYERAVTVAGGGVERAYRLHFEAVTHRAKVWLDGVYLGENRGGYLPFSFDVSELVRTRPAHRLTVAVSNVLDWTTVPAGDVLAPEGSDQYPVGYAKQKIYHDFFNYAGIHRSVFLVETPRDRIEDCSVNPSVDGTAGRVAYSVAVRSGDDADRNDAPAVSVRLLDGDGSVVADSRGERGTLTFEGCRLWGPDDPYLYRVQFRLTRDDKLVDVCEVRTGFRTVTVESDGIYLNGKKVYLKGFGRHEDAPVRGKGYDAVTLVNDVHWMKWIGANSFRTSHYPYGQEIMDMADELGFLVIDEVPMVGPRDKGAPVFVEGRVGPDLAAAHKDALNRLVGRDRHHPSVVMWSVANEPACWELGAREYFTDIIGYTRSLDSSRPITVCLVGTVENSTIYDLLDVISINRYFSWYTDPGSLDVIAPQLSSEMKTLHERTGRPVLVTEYGADAVAGIHAEPPVMFSEEYQVRMLEAFHEVHDSLPFCAGEHVWNFADFQTDQEFRRVDGNKKGVFTRDRRPKMAAHALRRRWRNDKGH
ncbi:MAG: beta-glucuronidase [Spirochaetales bacterium]|nr:beta-glucuronidase [Spirochaetales bacterium]